MDSIIVFGSYLIHYIFGICTGAVFIAAKAPCSCAHCVPVDKKKKKKNSFRFIIFYRNNNENGTIYFTNTFYFLGQPYTRTRLIFLSRKIFFPFFTYFFFFWLLYTFRRDRLFKIVHVLLTVEYSQIFGCLRCTPTTCLDRVTGPRVKSQD